MNTIGQSLYNENENVKVNSPMIRRFSIATNRDPVNGQTAWRKEEYFRQQLSANNRSSALWTNIIVAGGQNVTGSVYVASRSYSATFASPAGGGGVNSATELIRFKRDNAGGTPFFILLSG